MVFARLTVVVSWLLPILATIALIALSHHAPAYRLNGSEIRAERSVLIEQSIHLLPC